MNAAELLKGQGFVGYIAREDARLITESSEAGVKRRSIDGTKVSIVMILPAYADIITADWYYKLHRDLPKGHEHQFADGQGLFRWVFGKKDRRSAHVKLWTELPDDGGGQ